MGILIGMDEAGYGPNLGPLAVAATAWQIADGELASANQRATSRKASRSAPVATLPRPAALPLAQIDLYRSLRTIVSRAASERRIAIADSKLLYKPGQGLRQLERGVHAVLLATAQSFDCWSELIDGCGADPECHHRRACWPDDFDCRLPVDAAADELARLGARLAPACDAAGVRPLVVRARLVFPAEFNALCDYYGTKGAALSHITIGLLREVVDAARERQSPASSPQSPVFALCDKHGGRNFYTALLQHHFSEHWIQPVYESHAESCYEWDSELGPIQVSFRMQGERFLPTALASMVAKYLRELSMRAFNEFWCARMPNLRPTAGYYVDASRFKREIDAKQRELGIDDHNLWRNR